MTAYIYGVVLRFKHPAWDERDGIHYAVEATSKSDAISQVRKMAKNDGHTGPHKGRYTFTATRQ